METKEYLCIKSCEVKTFSNTEGIIKKKYEAGKTYKLGNGETMPENFVEKTPENLKKAIIDALEEVAKAISSASKKQESHAKYQEDMDEEDEVCNCEFCNAFDAEEYEEDEEKADVNELGKKTVPTNVPVKFKVGDYAVYDGNIATSPMVGKITGVCFPNTVTAMYAMASNKTWFNEFELRKPTTEELAKYFR